MKNLCVLQSVKYRWETRKLSHTACTVGDFNCTHWLLYQKNKEKKEKQNIYLSILIKFRGHNCQILDIWLTTPDH